MNRKKLFKDLNNLCLNLSDEYNINCGGCCYVAACIAAQLEKFNIPFKIIHYQLYSCHYAIKVSDRYINRDGYRKKEIYEVLECSSREVFERYYSGDWNPTYKTSHNSIVHKKINQIFNENNGT